jgi:outer membrane lipoprotein-sorting protein
MEGAALVSDGKKIYAYTPLDNTVRTASLEALEKAREAMKDMGGGMGMGFLSGFEDPEVAFDKLLDASDIRLVSEEKLNGRDTYKLEATPKTDAATRLGIPVFAAQYAENIIRGAKGTFWVDKDLFTPLKATLEHPSIGNLTYSGDWKLNGSIDADRFVLQIPPGAKVEDMDEHLNNLDRSSGYWVGQHVEPKTITIAEARELAQKDGWKLLEPSYLPQGVTLVNVQSMPAYPGMNDNGSKERHTSGITLSYSSPESDLTIHQSPIPNVPGGKSDKTVMSSTVTDGWNWMPFLPSGDDPTANGTPAVPMSEPKVTNEQVKVRGVDGYLAHITWDSFDQLSLSLFEADGTKMISISGKLTKDEILKIAEGLK